MGQEVESGGRGFGHAWYPARTGSIAAAGSAVVYGVDGSYHVPVKRIVETKIQSKPLWEDETKELFGFVGHDAPFLETTH